MKSNSDSSFQENNIRESTQVHFNNNNSINIQLGIIIQTESTNMDHRDKVRAVDSHR